MAFDGITVAAMVQELKNALADGRIAKIAQPEPDELLLTIKTPEGQKRLYISASASLPLIYLTDENKAICVFRDGGIRMTYAVREATEEKILKSSTGEE